MCTVSIFLTICLMLLSGCSISGTANYASSASADEKDGRPLVVTTIFPYYDFVLPDRREQGKAKMVVPAGMDSHSFEPTPADMITMQQADLMVCNGGEMEQWVEKVVASLDTGEHESPYDDGLCRCTGRGDRGRNGR